MVHYVSFGTPGGEYRSECRAAVITAVDEYQDSTDGGFVGHVDLCVLNPTGMFFDRGCHYHEGDPASEESIAAGAPTTPSYRGGTWHWPEKV